MRVISVLNQKGGAGKTTIATHIATALRLAGHRTVLIDSDPQGSARDWAAVRDDHPLAVVGIDRPTIGRDIQTMDPADYFVIDGAPQAADLAVSAIKASDFVLIPVQPSPFDIWATGALVELVKQRIEITDGALRAAFVISRAIPRTTIGREVTATLETLGLPVLAARVHQRVDYPVTAAAGSTMLEAHPRSDGAAECVALTNELLAQMNQEHK